MVGRRSGRWRYRGAGGREAAVRRWRAEEGVLEYSAVRRWRAEATEGSEGRGNTALIGRWTGALMARSRGTHAACTRHARGVDGAGVLRARRVQPRRLRREGRAALCGEAATGPHRRDHRPRRRRHAARGAGARVRARARGCVCVCVSVRACVCACVCVCVCVQNVCVYVCVRARAWCARACVCVRVGVCVRACVRAGACVSASCASARPLMASPAVV